MNNPNPIQRRGRLNRTQLANLRKLYNMLYTPAELAAVLGVTRRQFYRVYVPLGCPQIRDETGHLWINGAEFGRWYRLTYAKKGLQPGEAFCLTCKQAVPLSDPQSIEKGGMLYLQSTCPNCGRTLARFIENHWKANRFKTYHEGALR